MNIVPKCIFQMPDLNFLCKIFFTASSLEQFRFVILYVVFFSSYEDIHPTVMFINSAIWERTRVNEEKIQQFFFKLQNTIKENVHIMMIKPLWKHHGIIHCTSQFDCFFILVIDREGFFSYFVFRVIFISQTLFFSKKKTKKNNNNRKA